MKTCLPDSINNISQAKAFLRELERNNEAFHPEDDANDIFWTGPAQDLPSTEERDKLNSLMGDCYKLEGFDPCGYLLGLFVYDD
jgi:hypothetical protein